MAFDRLDSVHMLINIFIQGISCYSEKTKSQSQAQMVKRVPRSTTSTQQSVSYETLVIIFIY
jgi:hypothetical protein